MATGMTNLTDTPFVLASPIKTSHKKTAEHLCPTVIKSYPQKNYSAASFTFETLIMFMMYFS